MPCGEPSTGVIDSPWRWSPSSCWALARFYIADLVRTEAATLWAMLYFGAVCWAFSHERELQRQIDDIRAGRDPRRQH
jgi:hypothetical protein